MKRALALLALSGCNSILGIGDFHTGETSDAGVDATIGPDADPSSIVGTSMIGYVSFDGTSQATAARRPARGSAPAATA